MTEYSEHRRQPHRLAWAALAIGSAVVAVGLAAALWRPLPARSLVMATGAPGGAYLGFAQHYREILARNGVSLELRPSAGAVDNLALLRDASSGVSAAFAQAGTAPESAADALVSLGTVFYEPIWFFCRCAEPPASFRGLRMSVGPVGSSSREIAFALFRLNGIDSSEVELVDLDPLQSARALIAGDLDIAFVVLAWEAPVIVELLRAPGVRVLSFPRADAYVALYPYLTKLRLPMGVADLAANKPPEDVTLVAAKANLIVRRDLHPALQYLLIQAAAEVHGRPGIFQAAGQFPAAEEIDLPLSEDARSYYQRGPPLLQRHLPFWFAEIIHSVLLALIPLFGILYPLWSGLPRLYEWQMRRRVYRLYGELKWIERELHETQDDERRQTLLRQLDSLEERVFRMRMPNAYTGLGYTFRLHIQTLRASRIKEPPAVSGKDDAGS
jgi:TRAP-type uncharacterized transport system substrate-binding protein